MGNFPEENQEPAVDGVASQSVHTEGLPTGAETWDLAKMVLASELSVKEKRALFRELRKMSPRHNRSLYMTVVVILGLVVITTVLWGFSLLTFPSPPPTQLPAGLIALGSTALGALAGLLAPSPREE